MKSISVVKPALLFILLTLIISGAALALHFVKTTDETKSKLTMCAFSHIPEKSPGEKTGQLRCEKSLNSLFKTKVQII
jgi:hypothetical protein